MYNSTNGKGSKPRPIKNRKQFNNNWDTIVWNKNTDQKNNSESSSSQLAVPQLRASIILE